MKVEFTSLRLQADARGLIALHLPTATTLQIQSPSVWLTHSLSNQDYVFQQGATLSLMAGTILIEGESAVVELQASPNSSLHDIFNRTRLWFKHVQTSERAVCVQT